MDKNISEKWRPFSNTEIKELSSSLLNTVYDEKTKNRDIAITLKKELDYISKQKGIYILESH